MQRLFKKLDFSGKFGVAFPPQSTNKALFSSLTRSDSRTDTHLVPGQPLVHRLIQLRVAGIRAPGVGVQVSVNSVIVSHADRQAS